MAWEKLEKLQFQMKTFKGALVFVKGLGRTFFASRSIHVFPKQRKVEFLYEDHTDTFENGRIIYSRSKKQIENGRLLFRRTTFEQWYPQHAAYFFGYAWANYMSYPFILPNFELLNFKVHNNGSAAFKIRFPIDFHTHCQDQIFYFSQQKMLCRHDYRAELAGPLVFGAHFTQDYTQSQELQIGFIRKVRPRLGAVLLPIYGIFGEIEL